MTHSLLDHDGLARFERKIGLRVLCSLPTCRMVLAEYDPEQRVLWRTPGSRRQEDDALRLTNHARKHLQRGLIPADRRQYRNGCRLVPRPP